MATIAELKEDIDLHDLADKLGLKRDGIKGNYHSPTHKDTNASLSIFDGDKHQQWYDHSTDEGGSCIDLVMLVDNIETGEAIRKLHELYDLENTYENKVEVKSDKQIQLSLIDYIYQHCLKEPNKAIDYLSKDRKILKHIIEKCIKRKTIGFSTWTSDKVKPGENGYGGDAVAFLTKDYNTKSVVAVDTRYIDPELNGNRKQGCQGEKSGHLWIPCHESLKKAHTVVVVESPINALSALCSGIPGLTGVATRGCNNLHHIDWHIFYDKFVIVCMDNDQPLTEGKRKGHRPGPEAAWKIHEALTALSISCLFVDQGYAKWEGINDLNDYLIEHGADEVKYLLKNHFEPWLIPGLSAYGDDHRIIHKPRVYLPHDDYSKYWAYRVKPDYTQRIKDNGTDEQGNKQISFEDICGFRVAALSRIKVASFTATMSGEKDLQPKIYFAASIQTPRNGNRLIKKVFDDEDLHSTDHWKKFGPIFKPQYFSRMISIFERAIHIGSRNAINFVGLAWKDGKPVLNEGSDCFFEEPAKQCPYYNLTFPSGPISNAAKVILAYQDTYKNNAASQLLVWALGGHLKAYFGFYPHMMIQAKKSSGKSTIIKRLERTIAFTMFSGETIASAFRLLTSISHTSHPIGLEELSAQEQKVINKLMSRLQECYNYNITKRTTDMTEYLMSTPVLLAGEDVPVNSLTGKIIRVNLSGKKGALLSENLPRFPVREWILFLCELGKEQVQSIYNNALGYCKKESICSSSDDNANRMTQNYALVMTAWRLLCEFSGLHVNTGNFIVDCKTEMNNHIKDTTASREPWVWIMEVVLGQIDAGVFMYPYKIEYNANEDDHFLFIRCTHIMQHFSQSPALKTKFDGSPVKTSSVFKTQLMDAGIIWKDGVEKTIGTKRIAHMQALSISRLHEYSLSPSLPVALRNEPEEDEMFI